VMAMMTVMSIADSDGPISEESHPCESDQDMTMRRSMKEALKADATKRKIRERLLNGQEFPTLQYNYIRMYVAAFHMRSWGISILHIRYNSLHFS